MPSARRSNLVSPSFERYVGSRVTAKLGRRTEPRSAVDGRPPGASKTCKRTLPSFKIGCLHTPKSTEARVPPRENRTTCARPCVPVEGNEGNEVTPTAAAAFASPRISTSGRTKTWKRLSLLKGSQPLGPGKNKAPRG